MELIITKQVQMEAVEEGQEPILQLPIEGLQIKLHKTLIEATL